MLRQLSFIRGFRLVGIGFLLFAVIRLTAAEEPGTIGVGFAQLYGEGQPNKRGPLVALQIDPGLPGAQGGIQKGDIIVAINGSPVAGRELAEIMRKEVRGPVGGTVRLTIARLDGTQQEVTLTRRPYPPHLNPPSDVFSYSIPGSWRFDPRYSFPLPWSPSISYHGIEDLAFAPNFDDTKSPEYHSYLFFWWLDGAKQLTAEQLKSDMVIYFRGLAEERGKNYGFVPDLSKVSAEYSAANGAQMFGGMPANNFNGAVSIYDTHGQVIRLHSEVVAAVCTNASHTAVLFGMSLEPRPSEIWNELDRIRNSFKCSRESKGTSQSR